jgi:hypothetical protein
MEKKIILIIFFVICLKTGYSQTLESVWGIPMGIKYDSAVTLIKSKKIGTIEYKSNQLNVFDPMFGSYEESKCITFLFNEDKRLHLVLVLFYPEKNKIFNFFDLIKSDLTDKYGKCTESVEDFLTPYNTDYRKYPMMIEDYLQKFYSKWMLGSKFITGGDVVVKLLLTNDYCVGLLYDDLTLSSKVKEKQKEKKLNDY